MNQIFVYGTLLSGQGNNRRFLQNDESKLIGESIILGFTMHDLGAFPALVEQDMGLSDGENIIHGEVWEVSDEVFQSLDYLEGYPRFYNRKEVETEFGQAWVYFCNNAQDDPIIESGNWKEHLEV